MEESHKEKALREKIFRIIETADRTQNDYKQSQMYDAFMMIVIIISLIPLAFKNDTGILFLIDKTAAVIFIIDYLLRWATADLRTGKKSVMTFVTYPFTPMAIIDLLSILPSLTLVNESFKALRMVRMLRAARALRVLKGVRHSKNIKILNRVIQKSKDSLIAVGTLAVGYILISALIIFNVEPETFDTFFDAVYWATVSLTTVGYGDIYAVSAVGRTITMISSFLGIAIVALPAGIFTAEYISEIDRRKQNAENEEISRGQSD